MCLSKKLKKKNKEKEIIYKFSKRLFSRIFTINYSVSNVRLFELSSMNSYFIVSIKLSLTAKGGLKSVLFGMQVSNSLVLINFLILIKLILKDLLLIVQ